MLQSFWDKLWGPPENVPGPLYCEVYDMMRYRIADGDDQDDLPMVIAFRVKSHPQIHDPDPRPSFALLETAEEWNEWHHVFAGEIEWTDDLRVTDAPLLQWNEAPSHFKVDYMITTTYLPEDMEADWPPLLVMADATDATANGPRARGRYAFQQGAAIMGG